MNLIDKSYLHPVLRPEYDDVSGIFHFDLDDKVKIGARNYIIDIEATFENPTIQELIADGKAQIYVSISCRSNFYRKALKINSFSERVEIPIEELTGIVEVTIVVSAISELKYKNASQHPDYANQTFDIASGDILAVSRTCTFAADKEFDPLKKMESIISITIDRDLDRKDPLKIDFRNEKIKVSVAENVYQEYCMLSKNLMPQAIDTMIFLPILTSILTAWRHEEGYEEHYIQYRWFRAIYANAKSLNILDDITSESEAVFVLAQKMIDAPITRSLDEIKKKWNSSDEGDA